MFRVMKGQSMKGNRMKSVLIGAAMAALFLSQAEAATSPLSVEVVNYNIAITDAHHHLVRAIGGQSVVGKPAVMETSEDKAVSATSAVRAGWQFDLDSSRVDKGVDCSLSITQFEIKNMPSQWKVLSGALPAPLDVNSRVKRTRMSIFVGKESAVTTPLWNGMSATITAKVAAY